MGGLVFTDRRKGERRQANNEVNIVQIDDLDFVSGPTVSAL